MAKEQTATVVNTGFFASILAAYFRSFITNTPTRPLYADGFCNALSTRHASAVNSLETQIAAFCPKMGRVSSCAKQIFKTAGSLGYSHSGRLSTHLTKIRVEYLLSTWRKILPAESNCCRELWTC